jgi:hypothetical protein
MASTFAQLFKQRGHEVTKEGSESDILLPVTQDKAVIDAFRTILYGLMRNDNIRKALRDWAYDNSSVGGSSIQSIQSYVDLCRKFGNWKNNTAQAKQQRYAATFEWYISELLKREFGAQASAFGVRLKDVDPDDEFDCIALLDGGVAFVECKTGKGELYGEISKFLRRDTELCASHSFFIFDRDYTFEKGRDDTPKLTYEQAAKLGIGSMSKISAAKQHFFEIHGPQIYTPRRGMGDRYFFASTAFKGLESRIRYMCRYINELEDAGVSSFFTIVRIPFTEQPSQE